MSLMTMIASLEPSMAEGISIAVAGMLIVIFALTLISLFIAGLPAVLGTIATFWPEVDEPHGKKSHSASLVPDDDAVLAAIGYVLHLEFQKQVQTDSSVTSKN